jgi:hypothetical protein
MGSGASSCMNVLSGVSGVIGMAPALRKVASASGQSGRTFFDRREVAEPAPRDRREAEAVLARFSWTRPAQTELALLKGRAPIE